MRDRDLIAAGGSGQEGTLGALRVGYCMDLPVPRVWVVDSDVSGNPGTGEGTYATRKQALDALATQFVSLGVVGEPFLQTINPADLSAGNARSGAPVAVRTVADVFRLQGQGALDPNDDLVLDLLLSAGQRDTTIDDGFHGQPALGALIVRAAIETGAWAPFLGELAREARQASGLRVVIMGSVVGGVGTAVLPSLITELRKIGDAAQGVSIHGLFLLPWFSLQHTAQDATSRPPDVDAATMERNASALMRGYIEHIVTEQLDSAVLLSLPHPVVRTSQGGSLQRETNHYVNVIAALMAQRMLSKAEWDRRGLVGVAIGNDASRHYEGGADGPSYANFSLRRVANIARGLVAVTEALRFEVAQSDPVVSHHADIAALLKRQSQNEREHFVAALEGYHTLHQEIWGWLSRSLESQVGSQRADTLGAFVPTEGWQDFGHAGINRALRVAGTNTWWLLPLGRRLLRRLGPFTVPNDARGGAAAAAVVLRAKKRLIELTGR